MSNLGTSRRQFVLGLLTTSAVSCMAPQALHAQTVHVSGLRGSIDASDKGILPDAVTDQSRILQDTIRETASQNQILYLPPGDYFFSNIDLPDNTRIEGISGATRLIYTGRGHGFIAENSNRIELRNLIVDGANQELGDYTKGLLRLVGCKNLTLDGVGIYGSSKYGLTTEFCRGTLKNCDIAGAADAAIYAVESTGLNIRNNYIHDCANGGILVHKWQIGPDGTSITNNRIERINAANGGTGPFGNGINVFRAGDVMITDNHISDCAFSAIRANSASNILINGNTCLGSGETALYVEFAFQGAVVTGNLVDGGTMGIAIANFNKDGRLSTISGNVIRNIKGTGPYVPKGSGFGHGIAVEADASVTGNTIENVAKWGMLVGWGPYLRSVSISGNVIRKAPTGIAISVVDGVQNTSITNNIFDQTPNGAIIGHKWREPATRDLAQSGTKLPNLSISDNMVN